MRTDEDLMVAHVAGDATAFHELFERWAPVLHGLFRRHVRGEDDATDLVQQTFLQLHRARRDYEPGRPLRPWLFTIALNLQREHLRRKKRRPETPLEADVAAAPEPAALEARETAAQVRGALEALARPQREVIELHWFQGLSFPEVAAVVGASLSAVKVRAHRGYERLRELLGNREQGSGIQDPKERRDGVP